MKPTTQAKADQESALKGRNAIIQEAYFKIINNVKEVLPLYPTDYFRTYMEVDYSSIGLNCKHDLYSPIAHLQLEDSEEGLIISFASNLAAKHQLGNQLSNLLTRIVYKHTGDSSNPEPIEDCLSVGNYNVDDFRQAKSLLDRGFKDAKKTTVELLTQGA